MLGFAALRSKEVQLLEYLKDFEKDNLIYDQKNYKKLTEVKSKDDFKKMRKSGIFEEYQEEILKLSNYVEVSFIFYLNIIKKGVKFKRHRTVQILSSLDFDRFHDVPYLGLLFTKERI